jgi:hypothetical protein
MKSPSANELPQRENPASGVHIQLGQSNIVLLTINTEKREPWLASEWQFAFAKHRWVMVSAGTVKLLVRKTSALPDSGSR